MLLEAGDKVPADMRLTRLAELRINESALTGGSVPVTKDEVVLPQGLPVADRRNMAYSGTLVTTGSGAGIVIGRAADTELFEDLGTVRGDGRFLDVVLLRDLLGAVSELACGPLGVGLLVEERGDGLAERVRCDPLESSIDASLPPLASHVVRGEPRANPGGEDRVERVVSSGEFAVHHDRDGESGQDDRSEAGVAFRPFLSEEALALALALDENDRAADSHGRVRRGEIHVGPSQYQHLTDTSAGGEHQVNDVGQVARGLRLRLPRRGLLPLADRYPYVLQVFYAERDYLAARVA
ncbi:hypothetical protein Sar04_39410 [Salinispora arenicola]|uniref:P-type ATPase A domain-containing protein n=1 Tax=Salinispora arenicola TaxID=168697 RepID=A0ABQ4JW89_SALAC|nr:hypothetical protein Sar04_39410 [Salinispora arenicola]